jgi:hypothetical protein
VNFATIRQRLRDSIQVLHAHDSAGFRPSTRTIDFRPGDRAISKEDCDLFGTPRTWNKILEKTAITICKNIKFKF